MSKYNHGNVVYVVDKNNKPTLATIISKPDADKIYKIMLTVTGEQNEAYEDSANMYEKHNENNKINYYISKLHETKSRGGRRRRLSSRRRRIIKRRNTRRRHRKKTTKRR